MNLHRAKRVRFPKGKKVKPGDEIVEIVNVPANVEEDESDLTNPRAAAKERAKRRSQFTSELFREETGAILNDVTAAEMRYEVCLFSFSLNSYKNLPSR